MITPLYVALSTLLIVRLSLKVIGYRHAKQVSLGDGGDSTLRGAIAAQQNAVEYLPVAMLLLFGLEANDGPVLLVHLLGISMLTGRLIHARAMWTDNIPLRVRGMQITIWTLLAMLLANLVYLPFDRLVPA